MVFMNLRVIKEKLLNPTPAQPRFAPIISPEYIWGYHEGVRYTTDYIPHFTIHVSISSPLYALYNQMSIFSHRLDASM
mgnify:CR=1 FL=1